MTTIARKSSNKESRTVIFHPLLSSQTLTTLSVKDTQASIKEWLMQLSAVFPVSPSQSQEKEQEKMTPGICGLKRLNAFAKLDRDGVFLRMYQVSLLTNTLERFSGKFPKQGMIVDGVAYRLKIAERPTKGTGYGLLEGGTKNESHSYINTRRGNDCKYNRFGMCEKMEVENEQSGICLQGDKEKRQNEKNIIPSVYNEPQRRISDRSYKPLQTGQSERESEDSTALGESSQQRRRCEGCDEREVEKPLEGSHLHKERASLVGQLCDKGGSDSSEDSGREETRTQMTWATPNASARSGRNPNTGKGEGLYYQVRERQWPTPRAGMPGSRKPGTGGKVLAEEVKKTWLTPSTVQIEGGEDRVEKRTAFRKSIGRQYVPGSLAEQVKWPTPRANKVHPVLSENIAKRNKCNLEEEVAKTIWPKKKSLTNSPTHDSMGLDINNKENKDDTKTVQAKKSTRKTLFNLQEIDEKETIREQDGGYGSIQEKEILRPDLHGSRSDEGSTGGQDINEMGDGIPSTDMRDVQEGSGEKIERASSRSGQGKQRPDKLDDSMQSMSHEMALDEWEDNDLKTDSMQDMREEGTRERVMPDAYSKKKEIRRSFINKDKSQRGRVQDNEGSPKAQPKGSLSPTWCCWLMQWPLGYDENGEITDWSSLTPIKSLLWLTWDVDPADGEVPESMPTPRAINIENKKGGIVDMERVATGIKDRVNRLKAIGNGICPPCIATAWRILSEGIE